MPALPASLTITNAQARRIWLRAQRLDSVAPFGGGAEATRAAIEHLGYVQIDTIHVIERCHHHILFSRIPDYRREHLRQAQTIDKSIFEYWTHALSYVPTRDIRYFLSAMKQYGREPARWFGAVQKKDVRRVLKLIKEEGPLSIRDIEDDILVEKHHPWASRKPSKRALQLAFYCGDVTISARNGMLKTYELMDRHFGWETRPKPASNRERLQYPLDRALRSQGIVSLDSICHLDAPTKLPIRKLIDARVRRKELRPVRIAGAEKVEHWVSPAMLDELPAPPKRMVHILSPFDPLIIQRKRLHLFFGYEHRFEAYVPKEKRRYGYFALPVLIDDELVAAIDLKTDRQARQLRVQQWTWVGKGSAHKHKKLVEEELHRFEAFQLAS